MKMIDDFYKYATVINAKGMHFSSEPLIINTNIIGLIISPPFLYCLMSNPFATLWQISI